MGSYLGAVWRCRYFWLSLVKMDLRTRYRGSLLGLGWSLLQPLMMTVILCAAFHRIFQVDINSFGPFLMTGLALWNFVLNATLTGCQCFRQAESYIRQYPAPLAIYPLRTALGLGFHFLLALAVALLLAVFLIGVHHPLALLSLVPSTVLILVLGWSLALLAGLMNVHFPDTSHLTEVFFQGLFYLTPVMYPPELLEKHPRLLALMNHNPLVFFLDLLRQPILYGHVAPLESFAGAAVTVAAVASVASLLLYRLEPRVIYHL
ncbi:MAG TPA: ABC transporter permease [Gemmataceae bacterium]|nr:ABC transporter permease [Gemmataceae bacterium]